MDYSELTRDYLNDAAEHLGVFDDSLLLLEKRGADKEVILKALGSLHTFKGNSGMMGLESLKIYLHQVEEILKQVNDNRIPIGRVIDGLFESANVVRGALHRMENGPSHSPDLTGEILVLQQLLDGSGDGRERRTVEPSAYLGTRTDTIRVEFKRLDDLLNLVGELVISRTRLNQIEGRIRDEMGSKSLSKELNEGLEVMGKTIAGIQEGIMKARMLPIHQVFHKFPRMVRDLAKSQGKEMQLILEGEDTELDKTVIDEIGEPLLHIIRNAIDHGIEPPEERLRRGKFREGKIVLSAAQESNYILIRVSDDGRGIDIEKVREKALQGGLITPEEILDSAALLSLIFSAGFSTKEEATDVSGRGIGLDVVNRNISKLNGHVTVDSIPEKGTAFTIKLPLNLAIIPALMAETGGEVYAIPMSAVDESVKVREEDIHIINNREVIRFREKVLPVIRLNEFFGLIPPNPILEKSPLHPPLTKGGRGDLKGCPQKRFYLVIVGKADKRLAVAVDRLMGRQEIVIKPLDDTFGKSYGIAGASVLGDGKIVLIVDIVAFWNNKAVNSET